MNRSPLDHPANTGLRRHGQSQPQPPGVPPLASPDEVANPYETLGAHPDLVARLWVVFSFAGGTHAYALRLPDRERAEAIGAGATRINDYPAIRLRFDLGDFGPGWVFCGWFPDEEAWCRWAFQHAGSGAGDPC